MTPNKQATQRRESDAKLDIAIQAGTPTGEPSLFSFHGTVSELPIKPRRGRPSARIVAHDVRGLGLSRPGYRLWPWGESSRLLVDRVTRLIRDVETTSG